jgi:hypothetical protein
MIAATRNSIRPLKNNYIRMKKYILFLVALLILGVVRGNAQKITFVAKAPPTVILGTPFQLSYVINTAADADELRLPDLSNFETLAGPYTSSSQQIINGQYSGSMTITYTLQARKLGTFSVGPASIMISRQRHVSNGLTIRVLPQDKNSKNNRRGGGESQNEGSSQVSISSGDVFMKANVTKTRVYEQEAFLVTYKLYSLPDVLGVENFKLPEFKGFVMQKIDLPTDQRPQLERYNGHNYTTFVLYQVLLFPQRPGTYDIEKASGTFGLRLRSQRKVRSIFDDFFDTYQDVKRTLVAPSIRINVTPLPTAGKPATFSGAVGNFHMSAQVDKNTMKTNEPVTVRVTISGTGNLKLINTLPLKFPADFEAYEPKVDNNYRPSASGVTGTKTMEFLAIPRQPGDFVISPVSFSYFDVSTHSYKTISTPEYKLHVDKGSGSSSTVVDNTQKENIKVLNKDIRYINTDNFTVSKQPEFFVKTYWFWLLYLIPLLLAIVLYFLFRKQALDNANMALVRNRKANKMALKRLKLASIHLKEKKKEQFYDEILKACWGYLSYKLNIPVADLTKEKMQSELVLHAVDESLINRYMDLLNTCEFARYAPVTSTDELDTVFVEAVAVIEALEGSIKK